MENILDYFGCDVFSEKEMRARLTKGAYDKLIKTIQDGKELDASIADAVAAAMKDWAIEKGATHYTHWFQPLTGVTAEKHDSFLSFSPEGKEILELSGKHLIKGESDASSFPSGGLRATFEARGYTAWDCTSPAFLREDALGVTLCIPTVFCSYTGESLDQKTPLLRSMQAIDEQSIRLLRLFGNTESKRVIPMVGAEQEYFLVDRRLAEQREDILYTGRTLFGAKPPKGQELDDHYFGTINEHVGGFMKDLNRELWKLGVPAKTQHNEAAPAQHELAPLYEQANIATDHNQITMETMKRVAARSGYVCLLHEKPFAGVNGSGKHNNWSLQTDDGINLLKPGKDPHKDTRFLLALACILRAVDRHADLLRYSAANVGNDQRLGASEAPPAIVSVFLGEQLEDIIDQIIETGDATHSKKGGKLKTGVEILPDLDKDATDRNRTSPFAFTGNKFEFRMLGSMSSIAMSNIVINTIVAESFKEAVDALEGKKNIEKAAREYMKKVFAEHKRIIFSGNGYSEEWVKEAEKRGLPNLASMVDAIPAITSEKAVSLFAEFGVFTESELKSRYEIDYETYVNQKNIEANTMLDMTSKKIIPAVVKFVANVASSKLAVYTAFKDADVSTQNKLISEISSLLAKTSSAKEKLEKDIAAAQKEKNVRRKAELYRNTVVSDMVSLRESVDRLELLVDQDVWPMPGYGELMLSEM